MTFESMCSSESTPASYKFPSKRLKAPSEKVKKSGCEESVVLVSCGSFNPVTPLHLRIFEEAKDYIEKEQDREVIGGILSPVNDAYRKRKPTLISAEHRLKMCEIALMDSDWISLDCWEASQPEYSRSRLVLSHIEENVKKSIDSDNVRIMLLCGADLLDSFLKPGVWKPEDVEYILSKHGVVCCEREGVSLSKLVFDHEVLYRNRKNIIIVPSLIINDVSSTKIRTLVSRGHSVKYLVDENVRKYILDKELYKLDC